MQVTGELGPVERLIGWEGLRGSMLGKTRDEKVSGSDVAGKDVSIRSNLARDMLSVGIEMKIQQQMLHFYRRLWGKCSQNSENGFLAKRKFTEIYFVVLK